MVHDDPPVGDRIEFEKSIVSAREGSFSALGQLLEHYRDYLLRIANGEIPTDLAVKESPSDLVQDTFLQAARDFRRFKGKTEAELRGWLRQILVHNVLDAIKRWQATQKRATEEFSLNGNGNDSAATEEPQAVEPSPSTWFRVGEQEQRMRAALERLPPDYQQVIELRTFEELLFDEVGSAMNRSGDAARKLWWRAIERLADELATLENNGGAID